MKILRIACIFIAFLTTCSIAYGQDENILWDITHGVYLDSYLPHTGYLQMLAEIEPHGHTIVTTDQGVDNLDLSLYDVIVISWGTANDNPYQPNEVTALRTFVEDGGGILIMGDNVGCPNININPVSEEFGVTCGISSINPLDLYVNDLENHAVFDGISEIYFRAAGEISVVVPSIPIAHSNALPIAAAGEVGNGRVVVIGDANHWSDNYFSYSENDEFAVNVFNWLAQPESGIDDDNLATPSLYTLSQNYPNPFNASTTICYLLSQSSDISIDVYDLLGRHIETLLSEYQQAGKHQVTWRADQQPSGTYFYRLQVDDHIETMKMMLLK